MKIRLLGPVEVETDDGQLVKIGRRRERCLLAVLALNQGKVVPIDRLIDLLWDDAPPASARAAVHTWVSRIRAAVRVTGEPAHFKLITHGDGYCLDTEPGTTDADRFRQLLQQARAAGDPGERADRLRAALALWRGPPLADAASGSARERICADLEELRITAVEDRIEADLSLGRHTEVVAELVGLTREHPLRERLVTQQMLALHRCGRTGEALEAFQQLTVRLREDLGIEPGAAARQMHLSILRDEGTLAAPRDPGGGTASGPAQLPADVSGFTGRLRQLRQLDAVLAGVDADTTAMAISLVTGTAGVGKTALTVRWAHRVRDRFPDGQLYADLCGYSPVPPVRPIDVLSQFLRALGMPPHQAPLALDEAAAAYRTMLADRRVLIVLDNAADIEQVRPLLPGSSSSLVLVTSRDSLAGLVIRDGARRIRVDPMTDAEALELLGTVLPDRVAAEPAAADALVGACAGLPLALRITAELGATRSGTTLEELAVELADRRQRLDRLDVDADPRTAARTVFLWSYQRLPPSAARLFRRLGLHPGADIDAHAAAALDDTGPDEAVQMLHTLMRAHLVAEKSPSRFGLHDLIQAYAAERTAEEDPEPERHAALTRLFDHYVATAGTGTDLAFPQQRQRRRALVTPGAPGRAFTDRHDALEWLDAERANLTAVVATGAGQGWPDHAIDLAATIATYLDSGSYSHDALRIHGLALRAASDRNDRWGEGVALHNLGRAYRGLGHYDEALAHYRRALAARREAGDQRGEAHSLNNVGVVYVLLGRYAEAIEHHRRTLRIHRELGDRSGQGNALGNLGYSYEKLCQYHDAVRHHRQALAIHREVGDRVGESQSLDNLGVSLERLGRYRQAHQYHQQALDLRHEIGNRYGEAMSTGNLGLVLHRLGRDDEAIDHLQRAIAMTEEIGYREGQAEFFNDLGLVHQANGRYSEAHHCHRRALEMARELRLARLELSALNGMGQLMLRLGRPGESLTYHRLALDLTGRTEDPHQRARALDGIAASMHASGDAHEAGHHRREALAIYTRLGVPEAAG